MTLERLSIFRLKRGPFQLGSTLGPDQNSTQHGAPLSSHTQQQQQHDSALRLTQVLLSTSHCPAPAIATPATNYIATMIPKPFPASVTTITMSTKKRSYVHHQPSPFSHTKPLSHTAPPPTTATALAALLSHHPPPPPMKNKVLQTAALLTRAPSPSLTTPTSITTTATVSNCPLLFESTMNTATSASIAMLYTDTATKSEYCSSLLPLTTSQITNIKAVLKKEKKKKKTTTMTKLGNNNKKHQDTPPPATTTTTTSDVSDTTPIGLVVLFITVHPGCASGQPDDKIFFLPLVEEHSLSTDDNSTSSMPVETSLQLACRLISSSKPLLVYSCQTVMSSFMSILSTTTSNSVGGGGCTVPLPHAMKCMDPQLLSWLCFPHLIHDKTGGGYSLREVSYRHMSPAIEEMTTALWGKNTTTNEGTASSSPSSPSSSSSDLVERTRVGLVLAMRLGEILHGTVTQQLNIPNETILTEIQIAMLLAEMECVGMGFDRGLLTQQSDAARVRQREIEDEIAGLAGGRRVNLASPQQVADLLYATLRLPVPGKADGADQYYSADEGGGGRKRSRTAATATLQKGSTDEATLQSIAHLSPVIPLLLEHRNLSNFINKFGGHVDFVQQAINISHTDITTTTTTTTSDICRVHCSWHQIMTSTGRLSSSSPNLQAVTKYQLSHDSEGFNVRNAFVAPTKGTVLLSADYSQVELRLLAHFSGDANLLKQLQLAGPRGDVFKMIAHTWLGAPSINDVTDKDREKAKRIVYGLIYGLSPYGLAQQLGCSVNQAQAHFTQFLTFFPGVQDFITHAKEEAKKNNGVVRTISGRIRPLPGLFSDNHKVRNDAERRVVNSIIQGSAADILKRAMVRFSEWREMVMGRVGGEEEERRGRNMKLVASIHDELLFEVEEKELEWAAVKVRQVMTEGVGQLRTPLIVKFSAGKNWGDLKVLNI